MQVFNVKTLPDKRYPRSAELVARDVRGGPPVEGFLPVEDPDSETAPEPLDRAVQELIERTKAKGPPPRDPLELAHIDMERRQKRARPVANYRAEVALDGALARLEEKNIDLALLRVGLELDAAARRRARARRAPTFYRSQVRSDPREPGIPFHDYYKL